MIWIDDIEIIWFGSIKYLKYRFNKSGLNSIIGDNGSGKTTLLNALVWGLYGKTLKEGSSVEPWPQIIDKDYKGTLVKINFHDETNNYKIIRGKGYTGRIGGKPVKNRLLCYENEKEVQEARDKRDNEIWVKDKIGYSFGLFINTITFGQLVTRITQETGPNKKKVFDEAFETSFINSAKELVEKRVEAEEVITSGLDVKLRHANELLKEAKASYKKSLHLKREWRKQQEKRIDKINEDIKVLRNNIKALAKKWQDVPKIKTLTINPQVEKDEFKYDMELKGLNSELEARKNELLHIPKKCESCNRPFERKSIISRAKILKCKIEALKAKKVLVKKLYDKAKADLEAQDLIKKDIAKVERIMGDNKIVGIQIKNNKKQIYKLLGQIKDVQLEKPLTNDLKKLRGTISKRRTVFKNYQIQHKDSVRKLEILKWLVKDPLSNSGLKSFIFDSMLKKLNQNLKYYRSKIGFEIKVYVNMVSARKDIDISITRGENEVPYKDLSGGQKQLVDFTLAFALNKTVDTAKPVNIIIMDEVFESLDKNNIELVTELIQEMSHKKTIHLVTHREGFNPIGSKQVYVTLNSEGHTEIAAQY